jgi:transcriptional regulator with XRE-family HTH domain/anti-sigma regulatory factor (Ser/Thr protein kinase)
LAPVASEEVISLAERLKQRREERGISQSQAARELDVARTAYRLWELEAAKPSPDRWRLIARWLGVSVTTMLLAEELMTEEEASQAEAVEFEFNRAGRDWDRVAAGKPGGFFAQAQALLQDGLASGGISESQADVLRIVFDRMDAQSSSEPTGPWETGELRTTFPVDELAPRRARQALSAVAVGVSTDDLETARLLLSELVTNSVRHGPAGEGMTIGVFIGVGRDRLRVEVTDGSATGARPRTPTDEGGYGLALVAELASRWGAGRERDRNMTWFELDLPLPGV